MCACLFSFSSYDVVLNQPPRYVLRKYKELNATVVFSAEDLIWPDATLAVTKLLLKSAIRFSFNMNVKVVISQGQIV